jgi:hypothetical protein
MESKKTYIPKTKIVTIEKVADQENTYELILSNSYELNGHLDEDGGLYTTESNEDLNNFLEKADEERDIKKEKFSLKTVNYNDACDLAGYIDSFIISKRESDLKSMIIQSISVNKHLWFIVVKDQVEGYLKFEVEKETAKLDFNIYDLKASLREEVINFIIAYLKEHYDVERIEIGLYDDDDLIIPLFEKLNFEKSDGHVKKVNVGKNLIDYYTWYKNLS